MQRAIKFRVWDKLAECFIYPNSGFQNHYILTLNGNFWNLQNGSGGKECVVQQFIDLLDRNGKEIYEGDIVEVTYKMDDHGEPEKYRSAVVFENGAFGDKYDDFSNYLMLPSFTVEVVGNIFESSDAL